MKKWIPKWLMCASCKGTLNYSITDHDDRSECEQFVKVWPCACGVTP